ncbi:hypothetical protein [Nocardia brasiliensis]|uniref:hypothetical protein n=1 Tax=Nocardia brasiliensis TaxID=37326 RepID=UPI00245495D9|nr:hypothetical protein [Nocardia brasiliensis]
MDVDSLTSVENDEEEPYPNDLIVGFDEESNPEFPVMEVGHLHPDLAAPSKLNVDLLEIRAFRSQFDGAVVVQIDTVLPKSERLRVNVNDGGVYDGAVFDANPEAGDHGREMLSDYYGELEARLGQRSVGPTPRRAEV